ncbi:MAG: adenylosuccinate lyase, partial [Bacteroidales bacterium]
DFENAEGNAGIATALLEHLSRKLPVSRLQRDLSDSTVLRNIGVPLAHILIALKSSIKGLGKISLNEDKLHQELENNMTVVAEAIQTVLRTVGYPNPYEALKSLTRKNTTITKEDLEIFIDGLDIPEEIRDKLRKVTPFNYTGIIPKRIDD